MNLSRRHVLGLVGLGAASLALSACAGSGGGGDQQDSGKNLQFWSNHPGKSKETEQKLLDAWNQANPDSKVDLIDGGKDYEELAQKFNAALSGGDLPDVIVASDVQWFNLAINDSITALDDLWKDNGIKPDTYVDTLIGDYKYKDKHYGVPYSRSTCLMYWDKGVLAKAGLPTDRGPKTWQEFAEWAPKLVKANDGKPALAVPDGENYLDWYFEGMNWTFGGSYSKEWDLKFTDAKTVEAAKFLQDQVKQGHIKVTKDAVNDFGIGNTSGLLESTGSLGSLKETAKSDFVTTFLLGPKPGSPTGGAGLAIPSKISDDRKKKAAKFIDFLTSTENTITFTQATGYMPVRKDAKDQSGEKDYLSKNPNAETAIKQVSENTQPQDYARVFVGGAGKKIGGALDKVVAGEDVAKTLQDLQDQIQKSIDQDVKPNL